MRQISALSIDLGVQAEAYLSTRDELDTVAWYLTQLANDSLDLSTVVLEVGHHARRAELAADRGRLL